MISDGLGSADEAGSDRSDGVLADGYGFMPLPSDIRWSLVNDRACEATRSLPDDVVDQLLNGSRPPE